MKKTLQSVNTGAYTFLAVYTDTAGFSSLNNRSAQPRRAVFLCVSPLRTSFNGWALVGERSRSPVSSVAGLLTPPRARPPHLAVDGGPSQTEGARHAC